MKTVKRTIRVQSMKEVDAYVSDDGKYESLHEDDVKNYEQKLAWKKVQEEKFLSIRRIDEEGEFEKSNTTYFKIEVAGDLRFLLSCVYDVRYWDFSSDSKENDADIFTGWCSLKWYDGGDTGDSVSISNGEDLKKDIKRILCLAEKLKEVEL